MPRQSINIIFIEKIADLIVNKKYAKTPEVFNEIKDWATKKSLELSTQKEGISTDNKITQNIYQNYPSFRTIREYIRKIKTGNLISNIEERSLFDWPTSVEAFPHIFPWTESRNALDCTMWYMKKFSRPPSIGIVKWYIRISYATGSWDDIEQKCLKAEIFWCSEILNGYSKNSYSTLYEQLQLQFKTWQLKGDELETSGFNKLVNEYNTKPWVKQISPSYRSFFFEIMPHFKWFYDQNREYYPKPINKENAADDNYSYMISKLNSIENSIKQINDAQISAVGKKQPQINSWKLNI